MSEIRDKARENLEDKLWKIYSWDWHSDPDQAMKDALDEILSISELAIVDRVAKPFEGGEVPTIWNMAYRAAMRNMLKDGYVKEVIDNSHTK